MPRCGYRAHPNNVLLRLACAYDAVRIWQQAAKYLNRLMGGAGLEPTTWALCVRRLKSGVFNFNRLPRGVRCIGCR